MTRSSAAIVLVLVGGTTLLGLTTCRSCMGPTRVARRVPNFQHPIYQPGPPGLPPDFQAYPDPDALAPTPLLLGSSLYRPYYGPLYGSGLWYTWPVWTPAPYYQRYTLMETVYDPISGTTYSAPRYSMYGRSWWWSGWGSSGWGSSGSGWRSSGGTSAPAAPSVSRGGFGSTGHAISSGGS